MENFSFIPNHINIEGKLPFELMDGCSIKKASDQQINVIETNLQRMEGVLRSSFGGLPYKVKYSFNQISAEEMHVLTSPLERNEWKYYILTQADDLSYLKLQFASNLADFELTFDAFTCNVYEGQYGFGCNPEIAFRFFQENDLSFQHNLREENLEQIQKLQQDISNTEGQFPEIITTIKLFNSLRYIHTDYKFKTLALFIVIESLLTHKPTSSETGDSLTRQVKTKVPLLLRRAASSIDYDEFFKDSDESRIWKNLYEYRSALAHGRAIDLNKELKLLKNPVIVHNFLIKCIKKLLLQALIDPQLVTDLKEC